MHPQTTTITGLDPQTATKQEVFDFVAFKLIQQGKPSAIDGGGGDVRCRYRSEDGSKCAAGHLIPDVEYEPQMEGKGVFALLWHHATPTILALSENVEAAFLSALQAAHDRAALDKGFGYAWIAAWRSEMRCVAKMYALDASILSWREPSPLAPGEYVR